VARAANGESLENVTVTTNPRLAGPVETNRKRESRYPEAVPGPAIGDAKLRGCLERIVRSEVFARSPQARRFLEYVADRALNGDDASLKAYTIGVHALGVTGDRSSPETAARMQASRLRRLLQRYYETSGKEDELQLNLPAGSYLPVFSERREGARGSVPPLAIPEGGLALPSVRVASFECLSATASDQVFGRALSEAIVSSLVSMEGIRVSQSAQRPGAGFVLTGSMMRLEGTLRVSAALQRLEDDRAVWSERFDAVDGAELKQQLDRVAERIAAQIADPVFGALSLACRESSEFGAGYSALQDFFRFLRHPSIEGHAQARTSLEQVMPTLGGRGLIHAAYAFVLASAPLVGPLKMEDLASAEAHARAALAGEEPGPFALTARALVAYHQRDFGQAERLGLEALDASAPGLYLKAAAGNLIALSGNWELGRAAIDAAFFALPRLPGYLQSATCLDLLFRRSDPAAALLVAQKMSRETPAWGSFLEATCLTVLGQASEARRAAARASALGGRSPKQLERRLSALLPSSAVSDALLGAAAEVGLLPAKEARPRGKYAVSARGRSLPHELRVGILHSLSGPMSMCETHLVNAAMLAIDEINLAGGLLGRPVRALVEDGGSSPDLFQRKAEKLLRDDGVTTIFGCWMSSSRKAVLPAVEAHQALLWYPLQYEGLERSEHVVYTGSSLNQQVEPAVAWAMQKGFRRCLLVGSDYVYPRTANRLIRGLVESSGGTVLQEYHVPLGHCEPLASIAQAIFDLQPDIVFNTINGADNIAFFRELERAAVHAQRTPVLSFSLSEIELQSLGNAAQGHYACWSYFHSLESPENAAFVQRYRGRYGEGSVLSDPIVTAYAQVHLWKRVVSAAGSLDTNEVLKHLAGAVMELGGDQLEVRANHHVDRRALIGRAKGDRQFEIVWRSPGVIAPEPWLGVDQANILSRNLVLEALRALPEMAERASRLEARSAHGWS
jgi:urea ABC transporter urea binding protein